MNLFKVLSVLLDYPDEALWQHGDELQQIIAGSPLLDAGQKATVSGFVRSLLDQDPLDAQETYGSFFDRGRSLSLLLFEHVHGESRDRGQAMVDLLDVYTQHGFGIQRRELPDYLPVFLEFLSVIDESEARRWLGEVAHILALLAVRMEKRECPWGDLIRVLLSLADEPVDLQQFEEVVSQEAPDHTPEAMDAVWEEEAISFGGDAISGGCPSQTPPPGKNTEQPVHWVESPTRRRAV